MALELFRQVRRGADSSGPLLVLLHGLGSNEQDLLSLAPYLDRNLTVVAYRAPREYVIGGYAWFGIQWTNQGRIVDEDEAVESRDLLVATLAQLREEFAGHSLVLGGFSQGAMMSLGVHLVRPDLLDGTLMMSGRGLPRFLSGVDAERAAAAAKVPIFVQHGVYDEVLRVEEARETREQLDRLGIPATYREYAMGHEISMESLEDAKAWLTSTYADISN